MSDNLRTRIAAVLHQHLLAVLDDDWITCRCDDYLSRFTTETYERHVADAVIRELEADYILVPKSHTLARNAAFKYGEHYGI